MAILQDVEVRIALNTSGKAFSDAVGHALLEYQTPGTTHGQSLRIVEKYIEVVTRQNFQIEVYLQPSFDLYDADGVRIGVRIDGKTVNFHRWLRKESAEKLRNAGKPLIVSSVRRLEGVQHFAMGFAFGSLQLDETLDLEQDLADKQGDIQSSIKVIVERYTSQKLFKPGHKSISSFYKPRESVDVGKEVYKVKHIRHCLTPGLETAVQAPPMVTHEGVPYKKHDCPPLVFLYRYRDHISLQILGCISQETGPAPLVTSPAPIEQAPMELSVGNGHFDDDNVEITRAEFERLQAFERENVKLRQTNESLNQEITNMRAVRDQMTALMGGFGNAVATSPPATPVVKSEVNKGLIKQEGGERCSLLSPTPKERPTKRPRTFVELD